MKWNSKQKAYQRYLADPDSEKDPDRLAAELGVAPSTLARWEQREGFWEEINRLARIEAERAVPTVWRALLYKARRGDVPAIKLLFSLLGQEARSDIQQGPVQFKFIVENGNGASLTPDESTPSVPLPPQTR